VRRERSDLGPADLSKIFSSETGPQIKITKSTVAQSVDLSNIARYSVLHNRLGLSSKRGARGKGSGFEHRTRAVPPTIGVRHEIEGPPWLSRSDGDLEFDTPPGFQQPGL
jgi:hypothetical protein